MKIKKEILKEIFRMVLFVSIPFVCIAISNIGNGKLISDFFLPRQYLGNDELMYIKQVDGTLKYGMPLGFFGYNESHAIIGSYSCWSPVLMMGWIVLGRIIGWNSTSLVIINALLLSIAFFCIYIMLKPNTKKMVKIGLIYASTTWITRLCFTAIPEVMCYSLAIILVTLFVKLNETYTKRNLIISFIIVFLLTLMRPFYLLLIMMPLLIMWKNKLSGRLTMSIVLPMVYGLSYFVFIHYFCATFYEGTIKVNLINSKGLSLESGLIKLIYSVVQIIISSFKDMLKCLGNFIRGGGGRGLFMFLIVLCIFLYKAYQEYKKRSGKAAIYIIFATSFIMMLLAIFMFFSIGAGDKHMMEFVVWGIFALLLTEKLEMKEFWFLEIALILTYAISPLQIKNPSKAQIEECRIEYQQYKEELSELIILDTENENPSYSNTIDLIFADGDGTNWVPLLETPAGVGINFCYAEWFLDDNTEVKSRYVATVPGGECAKKCEKMGGMELVSYEGIAIYQLY